MQTLKKIVQLAKHSLTRDGFLDPVLHIEGAKARVSRPYPDAPEGERRLLLEALGFTLAVEDEIGELRQVFLWYVRPTRIELCRPGWLASIRWKWCLSASMA